MIQQIFAVFDSKAGAYLRPFMFDSQGMAIRAFMDVLKDPKHEFALHPEDYTLFHIGEFDNKTAVYNCLKTPKSLGLALEYMSQNKTSPAGDAPAGNG